jgi:hypothetical protein
LFRLVQDHLHRLQTVYDERFARIRGDACAHEYLLAFSCEGRYFGPSGHAKRLALWAQWLDTSLLAPVPHRHKSSWRSRSGCARIACTVGACSVRSRA